MHGRGRALGGLLVSGLVAACVGTPGHSAVRAAMLSLSPTDPVEEAVERELARHRLVLVYWPKLGACGACAAGAHDALVAFSERFADTAVIQVWPASVELPRVAEIPLAEVVRLSQATYHEQTGRVATPRLEAWAGDRLVGIQTLDERRAAQDFVALMLDNFRGLT